MKSAKLPVACLLFLSPLIGEYLLGSLPASMIALLPLMMAMYGAGAILIREAVRYSGGGWASIVLLATAYGLFEEGFVTQSLFNPNYLHLRLLDFGYLPLLGTALPWAIFVVSIHVVWSITVPVALKLPKPEFIPAKAAPHKAVLLLASFLAGSAFMLAGRRAESEWHLSWPIVVTMALGIEALFVTFVVTQTRNGQWDEPRRFALMAGAFLVYAWIGFLTDISLHGMADLVGHSIIAALLCAALVVIGVSVSRRSQEARLA